MGRSSDLRQRDINIGVLSVFIASGSCVHFSIAGSHAFGFCNTSWKFWGFASLYCGSVFLKGFLYIPASPLFYGYTSAAAVPGFRAEGGADLFICRKLSTYQGDSSPGRKYCEFPTLKRFVYLAEHHSGFWTGVYLSQLGWVQEPLVSSRQRSDGFLCLLVSELGRL